MTDVVAVAFSGNLLIGLILGLFLGLLVGPLIRAWLSWQEWVSASRAADLGTSRDADVFRDLVNRFDVDGSPAHGNPEAQDASVPGKRRDAS